MGTLRRALTPLAATALVAGAVIGTGIFVSPSIVAAQVGAPAFIHPTSPRSLEGIAEYRLTAIMGFLFDTTVAAARLIFAGVPKRFPRLKVVLGHLGGTLPYLVERMDRGFHAYAECRVHIDRAPSEYVKRMYVDTVNFEPHALRMAMGYLGADHLVFGSDYPHEVGSVAKALGAVRGLDLPPADQAAILGGTALTLLQKV
ncbi:MAG: amidohydrolase family protein [Gemmatimonadales bacterium]